MSKPAKTPPTRFKVEYTAKLGNRETLRRAGVPSERFVPLPSAWATDGNAYLAQVTVENVWIEKPIRDGWIAAYRLAAAPDGSPVIAELRMFPAEPGDRPGEWSGVWNGVRATVPAGGLTSRLLLEASPSRDLLDGAKAMAWAAGEERRRTGRAGQTSTVRKLFAEFGIKVLKPAPATTTSGRPRKYSDYEIARIAQLVDEARQRGRRDYLAYAETRSGKPMPLVRDMLARARRRGFFSGGGGKRGVAGGELTEEGRAALRRGRTGRKPKGAKA